MQEIINNRLEALRKELEAGQSQLQDLERQQAYVRDMVLRISGAIQILEEVLKAADKEGSAAANPPPVST
jgi:prefoldin subunit 5